MSEPVVILGGGGHGKGVIEAARAGELDVVGVLDARADEIGPTVLGVAVLGSDEQFDRARARGARRYVLGVGHLGDAAVRRRLSEAAEAAGLEPAVVVHPSAVISPSAEIGPGTVVMPAAVVHAAASVGRHAIVNSGAIVEHDCRVADHAHLATGAVLTGEVAVEAGAFVGAAAVVRHRRRIGRDATVGAGAVVIRDVPEGVTVVGNPARAR